jgi:aryl-alcohol dehydrogenase-like predicted oxidoreductase
MEALPIARKPRSLGTSPLAAFPIAYGCWRLVGDDVRGARAKLEAALALGIDLFDLADVYGLDHGAPRSANRKRSSDVCSPMHRRCAIG